MMMIHQLSSLPSATKAKMHGGPRLSAFITGVTVGSMTTFISCAVAFMFHIFFGTLEFKTQVTPLQIVLIAVAILLMTILACRTAFKMVLTQWSREEAEDLEEGIYDHDDDNNSKDRRMKYNDDYWDALDTFGLLGFVVSCTCIQIFLHDGSSNNVVIVGGVSTSMTMIWMAYKYKTTGL